MSFTAASHQLDVLASLFGTRPVVHHYIQSMICTSKANCLWMEG